ncbi:MAG: outer membrane protein assembly factor BamC [Methylococcales bacterium]|nr:outer membrane protein assembly factor BamC [Methylococcales bacterium]
MKHKSLISLCGAAVLFNLSACTTIKEAFPDKEKDYQFTTEIPKLIIPADLANGSTLPSSANSSARTQNNDGTTAASEEADKKPAEESTAAADSTAEEQPLIDPKSITVDLLESSNKIGYLRINVPFTTAWRVVSKGLSRKSIEVSERNQSDKIFTVQYDPDEKPIEDSTYLDEINFMLHGFQGNDKEYKLKLVETNQQTDVVILDEEQKPTSDEGGLKLLKVLQQSIKANLK